jgi:hypothetical protein
MNDNDNPNLTLIVNEDYSSDSQYQKDIPAFDLNAYLDEHPHLANYIVAFGQLMINTVANMQTLRLSDFRHYVKTYLHSSSVSDPYTADSIDTLRWLFATVAGKEQENLPEILLSESLQYKNAILSHNLYAR